METREQPRVSWGDRARAILVVTAALASATCGMWRYAWRLFLWLAGLPFRLAAYRPKGEDVPFIVLLLVATTAGLATQAFAWAWTVRRPVATASDKMEATGSALVALWMLGWWLFALVAGLAGFSGSAYDKDEALRAGATGVAIAMATFGVRLWLRWVFRRPNNVPPPLPPR